MLYFQTGQWPFQWRHQYRYSGKKSDLEIHDTPCLDPSRNRFGWKKTRSGAKLHRWIPVRRRRMKEMTSEKSNGSSWSTHEKLIKKRQSCDDFAIIESREKKEDIHNEFDMGSTWQAGVGGDGGPVIKEDACNRVWQNKFAICSH